MLETVPLPQRPFLIAEATPSLSVISPGKRRTCLATAGRKPGLP